MRDHKTRLPALLSLLLAVAAVQGSVFTVSWWTVDNGGTPCAEGPFEIDGTTGQPDASSAEALTGGGYTLTGGYWAVVLPACERHAPVDFDQDCDVDLNDLVVWASCAEGPSLPHGVTAMCQAADLDNDGDVDQVDFAVFQRCFTGPQRIADPDCAE